MAQQQTLLRVKVNDNQVAVPSANGIRFENPIYYGIAYTGGTGTQNDPFTGSTVSGVPSYPTHPYRFNVINDGESGTLYYSFSLAPYTGSTINFYDDYNFNISFQNEYGNQEFITDYAVSNINGRSLKLPKQTGISFFFNTLNISGSTTFSIYFVPDNVVPPNQNKFQYLDCYASVPIKINKSFAELQDISKRNSDYSIGLLLPGSKENNRFFESFYNVDSTTLFFDATKRVPAQVLIEDQVYFDGYLRLNKVSVLNSKVEYDVTLYSNIGDIFGKIGNNLLKDLDYDDLYYHFNHYFTLYNITSTWIGSDLVSQYDTPELVVYPVIHNGYLYSGDTVNLSGDTVASQSRLYTSTKVGNFTDYSTFISSGGTEYHINSPKHPILDNQLKPSLNVWGLIQLMFKTYGYTIKSDFFNSPWFKTLYTYGYFSSDTTKLAYQAPSPQTYPIEQVDIIPYLNNTSHEISAIPVLKGTNVPCLCSNDIVYQYVTRTIGPDPSFDSHPGLIKANTTGSTYHFSGVYVNTTSTSVYVNKGAIAYLPSQVGQFVNIVEYDYVNFNQIIDVKIKQIDFLASIAKKFDLIFTQDPLVPNQIIIEPYDYYVGTGKIYDWTDKISFDKGWSVQPALNFIESEIFLTDLEDGDDGNVQFKNKNNRIYGEMHQYNQTDFKSQVKKIDTIFSSEIIRKWDNNIGLPLGINYVASSNLDSTTNTVNYQYKGVKTKPKLFFNMGNFSPFLNQVNQSYSFGSTTVDTMFFRAQQSDGTNPLNGTYALTYATNPSISHTMPVGNPDSNKINNDSICILFNSEQPVDLDLGQPTYNTYTNNDTYQLFYSNRINNLYNKSTRFLTGNFYITQSDINNLRANDVIKIQDQYFSWNKVNNFNLTQRELTEVELVQMNLNPMKYPTRYFKYQYCGNSNVYKLRTYFNPLESISTIGEPTALCKTNYYWSVFYDYMVGVLGGNVSGFTTSFPIELSGSDSYARNVLTMTEITEIEYNTISLTYMDDPNNGKYVIQGKIGSYLNVDLSFQNPMIWVFSNIDPYRQAFLNVATNCTNFLNLCTTNHVTVTTPV